jgi:DNA-binding MarR family transcriptional regulator
MPPRPASPRAPKPAAPGVRRLIAAELLHRNAIHLLRLLRREDRASGVSPARLSALSVLVFGGPCTLGALALAEQVSAPTMSRLVAELEREGWLVRRTDPADARTAHLAATAAARRLLLAGRERRLAALSAGLAALSAADVRAIDRVLPALDRLVRALEAAAVAAPARAARRRFD